MSWNYRIVKHVLEDGEPYYGLHEVHYDDKGEPKNWTESAARFGGDSAEEVQDALFMAIKDAFRYPVFEPPKED